jgi:isoleucyl-tRNA synthetase
MIWNMYDFFTLYAEVDNWEWDGQLNDPTPELENPLDEWIVSRVHQLNEEVERHMDRYDLPNALKPVLPFIEDASNWFVRRSRKRFWKSDSDADKQKAYRTLHYVLVQLSMVLAPFTPFLAEELYQKLTGGESVHLLDWPEFGHINELLIGDMKQVREIISEGLAERATASLKVRQPLSKVSVLDAHNRLSPEYKDIIAEELNVKSVEVVDSLPDGRVAALETRLTTELKREGMMREIVRNVQQARKQAGLEVADRIDLVLETDDAELTTVLNTNSLSEEIMRETLAVSLNGKPVEDFATTVKIDGAELTIKLGKA